MWTLIVLIHVSLIIFSINNNNSTREHLLSKQAIIEKCLNNTPSQRIENQMKTFFAIFKKYEEFLLIIVQCKAEFQGEESNDRGELEGQENKTDDEENKILYVEKELCFMEQTDHDIDLEVERFKISVDLIKTNEKELKNVNLDMESIVMELQEKSKFSAEQENSIANINEANRELMCECEELIVKKTKLQDNSQQLEIKMEQISTLVS